MKTRKKATVLLMILGILLIAASASTVILSHTAQKQAAEGAKQDVTALFSLIPDIYSGAPDGRSNTAMAALELNGTDFSGILEVPLYDAVLPLCSTWDKRDVNSHPCIYTGSMYDSSLVIGGSGNRGQLDFLKWLTGGDRVSVTDMTGLRYSYLVSDVMATKDVSYENLTAQDADLILFARDTFGTSYTLVLCKLK